MNTLSAFFIAGVAYAVIASFLPDNAVLGLSILLIMGALVYNAKTKGGSNFLSDLGIKGSNTGTGTNAIFGGLQG